MTKDNELLFDNVKPDRKIFYSKKINFIDKNDLIENEEKIQSVSFAKKANLFFSVLTISFITFISFNLVKHSYNEKKKSIKDLKNQELSLINQINDLELKNSLLSDNLDLDYIETLIRERFLFGKKNEKIYVIKKNED